MAEAVATAPPSRRWADLSALLISAAVITASVLLDGNTEQVTVFGHPLPPLCLFRSLLGVSCPGCGMTRSFVFMGGGHPVEAFKMHFFGPILWIAVAAQVPFRLIRLLRAA